MATLTQFKHWKQCLPHFKTHEVVSLVALFCLLFFFFISSTFQRKSIHDICICKHWKSKYKYQHSGIVWVVFFFSHFDSENDKNAECNSNNEKKSDRWNYNHLNMKDDSRRWIWWRSIQNGTCTYNYHFDVNENGHVMYTECATSKTISRN